MIFTTTVVVAGSVTAFVTGITCAIGFKPAKEKIKRKIQIRRMRKKIKLLIDDIEDRDPESLMNIVCETNPCREGQKVFDF